MISGFKHCFLEVPRKREGKHHLIKQKRYLRQKIGVRQNITTGIGNVFQMKAV